MIERARKAQRLWGDTDFEERARRLRDIAASCAAAAETIGTHIHEEMGKPLDQAIGEVKAYCSGMDGSIKTMRQALTPDREAFAGGETAVHYVPLGVAAVITPWNFPFGMPWTLLVPNLLAGNTVIFKPTEIAPRTGIAMADIFAEHLPPDVLSTVIGAGEIGAALTASEVDLIGFVGSRETGKRIMKTAAERATRVLLEMGGKDPMIVADDADLDAAALYAARGANRNSGQVCVSVERIYVDKKVAPEFTKKVAAAMERITIGPENKTDDELLNIGPFASERQMNHVLKQLQDAKSAGAEVVGGERLDRPGFWMRPALVTGVNHDMAIMRDETFGPVTCIETVDDMDEAIAKANATRFGLAATLWSNGKATALAPKIEAGMIGVNRSFGGSNIGLWAGAKESGYGHTGGVSGMRNFLQPRTITTAK